MGRILILEDELSIRRSIEISLQKEGYEVKTAGSISEAEQIMGAFTPEMLLCDINLPDGSGLDYIKGLSVNTDF